MDGKKTTQQKVEQVLDTADQIKAVNEPPFFKDRVLREMAKPIAPKTVHFWLDWFTPKYQVAAIVLFVVLNALALWSYNNQNEQQELQTFAQTYGLSASESESFLN
ncbi:hypothetical protein [Flagellimonas flava]|uniref:Uncharacterized protein n=1 Tax=Flagellimonas flava TaxID=570519 RepID=A0A1M5N883_9FLAO|nr:hypothetical protein [Allomuricauda flava]SHG85701.1 hypothetical protein SAMN04488116_2711 [Allomuricauda flava]